MSKPESPKPEHAIFQVRVIPRSSRVRLSLESECSLKAWVNAPPVDGAANEAVCELIAETLKVSKGSVILVSGHAHRNKVVRVNGLSQSEASFRIGPKGS